MAGIERHPSMSGDNLGNHVATQDLNMNGYNILDVTEIELRTVTVLGPGAGWFGDLTFTGDFDVIGSASVSVDLSVTGNVVVGGLVDGVNMPSFGLVARQQRVLRSDLCPSTGMAPTEDTAYFVYIGKTLSAFTPAYVKFNMIVAGTGAQTAEVGLFSTPAAATGANQTLTKIEATGTVDTLTATAGEKGNSSAFTTAVAAGTHLWAGIRTAMATNEPTITAAPGTSGRRFVLQTATAGALTASSTFAGVMPAHSGGGILPDLYITMDA